MKTEYVIAAFITGVVTTTMYFKTKLKEVKKDHEIDLEKTFGQAYEYGVSDGRANERRDAKLHID